MILKEIVKMKQDKDKDSPSKIILSHFANMKKESLAVGIVI